MKNYVRFFLLLILILPSAVLGGELSAFSTDEEIINFFKHKNENRLKFVYYFKVLDPALYKKTEPKFVENAKPKHQITPDEVPTYIKMPEMVASLEKLLQKKHEVEFLPSNRLTFDNWENLAIPAMNMLSSKSRVNRILFKIDVRLFVSYFPSDEEIQQALKDASLLHVEKSYIELTHASKLIHQKLLNFCRRHYEAINYLLGRQDTEEVIYNQRQYCDFIRDLSNIFMGFIWDCSHNHLKINKLKEEIAGIKINLPGIFFQIHLRINEKSQVEKSALKNKHAKRDQEYSFNWQL